MPSVAEYIESNRELIVERWSQQAGKAEAAKGLRAAELIDTLPEYLGALAMLSRRREQTIAEATRSRLEETHISLRLRLGYSQAAVLWEYALLGEVITALWMSLPRDRHPSPSDVGLLFEELQAAMDHTVKVFSGQSLEDMQADKKNLRRLELLSRSGLEEAASTTPPGARISALLSVIQEAMQADGAALLLTTGGDGYVRLAASLGLGAAEPNSYAAPISGENLCARVARSPVPIHVPNIAEADIEAPPSLRASGLRSVLGVRLWPHGTLLGVVHIGVVQMRAFSPTERRRLETLCDHVAGLLQVTRLTESLHEANVWLRRERELLHRERELRERLVSVLAHDMRGPLSTVKLSAEVLVRSPSSEDRVAQLAQRIANNADRIDAMIRELLDASRLGAHEKLELHLAECDLGDLAAELVDQLGLEFGRRVELQRDGALRGVWSAVDLRRAIWNLITNALKHGDTDTTVTVRVRGTPAGATLSVHNFGPPISSETQQRIFEPFVRGGHERGDALGWGLGLAAVKTCVAAHGGQVRLDGSTAAGGTTFTLELPLDSRPFAGAEEISA